MSDDASSGGGLGLLGIVWIVLIILKAMGHLTWGWIPILLFPIWFPFALILAVIIIALGFVLAIGIIILVAACILKLCGVDLS